VGATRVVLAGVLRKHFSGPNRTTLSAGFGFALRGALHSRGIDETGCSPLRWARRGRALSVARSTCSAGDERIDGAHWAVWGSVECSNVQGDAASASRWSSLRFPQPTRFAEEAVTD